jgi:hypothetical protein
MTDHETALHEAVRDIAAAELDDDFRLKVDTNTYTDNYFEWVSIGATRDVELLGPADQRTARCGRWQMEFKARWIGSDTLYKDLRHNSPVVFHGKDDRWRVTRMKTWSGTYDVTYSSRGVEHQLTILFNNVEKLGVTKKE